MSSKKPRQYKPSTIRRLDTLSGNQCASPTCDKPLVAKDGMTIISYICHIEAACEGGPRFNNTASDEDRRHFDNLILLCDECHNIIDNPENELKYSVELLKSWKQTHESKQLQRLNNQPSLLKLAINEISNINFDSYIPTLNSPLSSYNIEDKISYNYIKRNKSLIEEYKVYYVKVAALYEELELQGSFRKDKLLRNINRLYLKTVGKYIHDTDSFLEAVRANSDNIIEDIENELEAILIKEESPNNSDFAFAISVIMVDAFIRCKILEEPIK